LADTNKERNAAMPELTIGSITLNYRISGSGPYLVLIPGMGMPQQGWGMQIQTLSRTHTVIRFDNRGCGKSSTPEHPYTITDMAGDVLALMDHLAVDTAHILGASMGGFIALTLALAAPDRIASLILAHTAPSVPPLARQRLRLWMGLQKAGIPDHLLALEQLIWIFPENSIETAAAVQARLDSLKLGQTIQSAAAFKGQAKACETFDLTGRLHDIFAPALLISSQDDIAMPMAHTRKLEVLPGFKKTKIFDYGGHATHIIQARAFNQTVLKFLSDLPMDTAHA